MKKTCTFAIVDIHNPGAEQRVGASGTPGGTSARDVPHHRNVHHQQFRVDDNCAPMKQSMMRPKNIDALLPTDVALGSRTMVAPAVLSMSSCIWCRI